MKIETNLLSEPTVTLPSDYTALHIAYIAWDLYSMKAPTHFSGEFQVSEGGDFEAYNVHDAKDISDHYYETAFSIANSVRDDLDYSVQDAFNSLADFSGDTIVRDEVYETAVCAVQEQIADSTKYSEVSEYIAQDYTYLAEDLNMRLPSIIANLNKKIAKAEKALAKS